MTREKKHETDSESTERLVDALENIARSLEILSGRRDPVGGGPGHLEAIAMVLGCHDKPFGWPNIGDSLERIATALESDE